MCHDLVKEQKQPAGGQIGLAETGGVKGREHESCRSSSCPSHLYSDSLGPIFFQSQACRNAAVADDYFLACLRQMGTSLEIRVVGEE